MWQVEREVFGDPGYGDESRTYDMLKRGIHGKRIYRKPNWLWIHFHKDESEIVILRGGGDPTF